MRMRQRFHEERGAVAVIVGLALVVLLGMLALTVDLGRAVGIRRDMVNASDAAALAAAQECAKGNGAGAATSAANQTADLNDDAASLVSIDPGPECVPGAIASGDPKPVTVTYTRTVDYLVAPVLGFDDVEITTTATAVWGAAQKASPIPIRLNMGSLANCGIDDFTSDADVTCYFLFDNSSIPASDWGWLYFGGEAGTGWNADLSDCNQSGGVPGNLTWFINGGGFATPEGGLLNDPPPTYVCSTTGNPQGGMNNEEQQALGALVGREGDILVFPIVDAVNYPVLTQGSNTLWPVIAFVPLRLIAVYGQTGNQDWPEQCPTGDTAGNGNGQGQGQGQGVGSQFCLQLRWEGPVLGGGSLPGYGPYTGLPAVALVE